MNQTELKKAIDNGSLNGLLLFDGNEEYIKKEALSSIEEKFLTPGFEMLNESVLENPDDTAIFDSAQAVPFMSERRIVVARDPQCLKTGASEGDGEEKPASKKDADKDSRILSLLSNPPADCVIILYVRGECKQNKLFKAVSEAGRNVRFDYLNANELVQRLNKKAKLYGSAIEPDAAEELIQACSYSLTRLEVETDKLLASKGKGGRIEVEDVLTFVTADTETQVFRMIDTMVSGHLKDGYTMLNALLDNGEKPVMVISLITRQFRLMCHTKTLYEKKVSIQDIQKALDLKFESMVRRYVEQTRSISAARLRSYYQKAVETEELIKTSVMQDTMGLEEMMMLLGNISK